MPNFSAHLGIAKAAASRLMHPIIDEHLGAFLLGSVSPDVRIITRQKRDNTHFVELDFQRQGEGLERLFRVHPELTQASELTGPTKAFIVGYASHLFADELWILDLYRPYFGNRHVFQDKIRGDLMDRALQLEMDRKEQLILGGLQTLLPLMSEAEEGVEVGFIAANTMLQWREWVQGALDSNFTWDRLRFMARRVASRNDDGADDGSIVQLNDMVEEFLESVSEGLDHIYQVIPIDRLEAFRERSIDHLMEFARGYLK